jgi:hypothetical protein
MWYNAQAKCGDKVPVAKREGYKIVNIAPRKALLLGGACGVQSKGGGECNEKGQGGGEAEDEGEEAGGNDSLHWVFDAQIVVDYLQASDVDLAANGSSSRYCPWKREVRFETRTENHTFPQIRDFALAKSGDGEFLLYGGADLVLRDKEQVYRLFWKATYDRATNVVFWDNISPLGKENDEEAMLKRENDGDGQWPGSLVKAEMALLNRDKVLLFGGQKAFGVDTPSPWTWLFDRNTNRWEKLDSAPPELEMTASCRKDNKCPSVFFPAGTYKAVSFKERNAVVLFATAIQCPNCTGHNMELDWKERITKFQRQQNIGAMFVFNGADNKWAWASIESGAPGQRRRQFGFVKNGQNSVLVLGGNDGVRSLDSRWEGTIVKDNVRAWAFADVKADTGPEIPGRFESGITGSAHGGVLLFGGFAAEASSPGREECEALTDHLWYLDARSKSWVRVDNKTELWPPKHHRGMLTRFTMKAKEGERKEMFLLHGGIATTAGVEDGLQSTSWLLDGETFEWTKLARKEEDSEPPRNGNAAVTWESNHASGVLMYCGGSTDVWYFSCSSTTVASCRWREVTPDDGGPKVAKSLPLMAGLQSGNGSGGVSVVLLVFDETRCTWILTCTSQECLKEPGRSGKRAMRWVCVKTKIFPDTLNAEKAVMTGGNHNTVVAIGAGGQATFSYNPEDPSASEWHWDVQNPYPRHRGMAVLVPPSTSSAPHRILHVGGLLFDTYKFSQGSSVYESHCPNGQYSVDRHPGMGETYCQNCQVGYYKSDRASDSCLKCPNASWTEGAGSKTISSCKKTFNRALLANAEFCTIDDQYQANCQGCKKGFWGSQCQHRCKCAEGFECRFDTGICECGDNKFSFYRNQDDCEFNPIGIIVVVAGSIFVVVAAVSLRGYIRKRNVEVNYNMLVDNNDLQENLISETERQITDRWSEVEHVQRGWKIPYSEIQSKEHIAKGQFADIFRGTYTVLEGIDVAIKCYRATSKKANKEWGEEIVALQQLRGPTLLLFYGLGSIDYPGKRLRYLITEFAKMGDLKTYIEKRKADGELFDIYQAMKFTMDITEALAYLHEKQFVHGKIKSSNILVAADGRCKLSVSSMCSISGTVSAFSNDVRDVRFLAPETFTSHTASFDALSDAYSYGMVLYNLLTFNVPWEKEETGHGIIRKVLNGARPPYDPPESEDNSKEGFVRGVITKIMVQCWSQKPSDRPLMKDVWPSMKRSFRR